MLRLLQAMLALVLFPAAVYAGDEPSLRGSHDSMVRQNRVARNEAYAFLRTPAEIRRTVEDGGLVPVQSNGELDLARVSFPVARPEVRLFVERLAAEYHAACGEPLVITSLTRPRAHQPRNASPLSVHPAGMAVDLRIPRDPSCRSWLEERLLSLEADDLLDVTRERRPPHYHVALFPSSYRAHMGAILAEEARQAALEQAREASMRAALREAERGRDTPAPAAPAQGRTFAALAAAGLPLVAFVLLRRRRPPIDRLPRHRRPPTI